ncbi:hypothetical protein TNCV_2630621 [Trichonephila clavipes]|uniref:Uncharacterized protein n=1 Tax=Trichonephila clavipes TaxID=2585209 RepID=A0A8X6VLA1_TRICX|nr:hypothetical protein TNCV_2630621 [Trichonephila clavipes]
MGGVGTSSRMRWPSLVPSPRSKGKKSWGSLGNWVIVRSKGKQMSISFMAPKFLPTDDEAHFWLNGYVNKQNCRIWSEANPQVYVETPLHPEKLTVWCALWAGGILLQKR